MTIGISDSHRPNITRTTLDDKPAAPDKQVYSVLSKFVAKAQPPKDLDLSHIDNAVVVKTLSSTHAASLLELHRGFKDVVKTLKTMDNHAVARATEQADSTEDQNTTYLRLFQDKFEVLTKKVGEAAKNTGEGGAMFKGLAGIGPAIAVIGTAVAAWKVGGKINEGINSLTTKLTGGKSGTLGEWVYDKLHPEVGAVSASEESGGKKNSGAVVSSGTGDHGGKSYGTYQLSSKAGSLQAFTKSSGYDKQFAGLKEGSKEYDAKWKDLSNNDPNFNKAQNSYAQKKYLTPQLSKLKGKGLDTSSRAIQELAMSTGVQYGEGSNVILEALKDKDASKMSSSDIINAVQDYKTKTVGSKFKSSSKAVQSNVADRHDRSERAKLLKIAETEKKGVATAQTSDTEGSKTETQVERTKPIKAKPPVTYKPEDNVAFEERDRLARQQRRSSTNVVATVERNSDVAVATQHTTESATSSALDAAYTAQALPERTAVPQRELTATGGFEPNKVEVPRERVPEPPPVREQSAQPQLIRQVSASAAPAASPTLEADSNFFINDIGLYLIAHSIV